MKRALICCLLLSGCAGYDIPEIVSPIATAPVEPVIVETVPKTYNKHKDYPGKPEG